VSPHLGTLLDWSFADLIFLGIAVQQYVSITRDIKRSRAREQALAEAGHAEGEQQADPGLAEPREGE